MIRPSFGRNIILNYIGGISGTIMVFSISMLLAKYFNNMPFVKTISRNTLFIIFFHWFLLNIISRVNGKINKVFEFIYAPNILFVLFNSLIITIVILYISHYIINIGLRRFPIVFGKQKKIRL